MQSTLPNIATLPGPLPPLQAPFTLPGMPPISLPPLNPSKCAETIVYCNGKTLDL